MDMPKTCYECRFCNTVGEDDAWVCDAFLSFIPTPTNGILETCPLEEVEKVGYWKEKTFIDGSVGSVCSRCETVSTRPTNYCQNCGAKMRWNDAIDAIIEAAPTIDRKLEEMERSEE